MSNQKNVNNENCVYEHVLPPYVMITVIYGIYSKNLKTRHGGLFNPLYVKFKNLNILLMMFAIIIYIPARKILPR